jgi:hypothetical protein
MSSEEILSDSVIEEETPDDAIMTGCYLCYGQCSNMGFEGRMTDENTPGVRPCSKGLAAITRRRRMRENRPKRGLPGVNHRG